MEPQADSLAVERRGGPAPCAPNTLVRCSLSGQGRLGTAKDLATETGAPQEQAGQAVPLGGPGKVWELPRNVSPFHSRDKLCVGATLAQPTQDDRRKMDKWKGGKDSQSTTPWVPLS